jgi:hypothetical protein
MIFTNLEKEESIIEIITLIIAQRSLKIKNVQPHSINQFTPARMQRYYYSTKM